MLYFTRTIVKHLKIFGVFQVLQFITVVGTGN